MMKEVNMAVTAREILLTDCWLDCIPEAQRTVVLEIGDTGTIDRCHDVAGGQEILSGECAGSRVVDWVGRQKACALIVVDEQRYILEAHHPLCCREHLDSHFFEDMCRGQQGLHLGWALPT